MRSPDEVEAWPSERKRGNCDIMRLVDLKARAKDYQKGMVQCINKPMERVEDTTASGGIETNHGTYLFFLSGDVANRGLHAVPFGATLRHIVAEIGGGVLNDDGSNAGADLKAVQIGGTYGSCLTQAELDMPLDYDHIKAVGATMGSGSLVVMNHQTCMVQAARSFLQSLQDEAEGNCGICQDDTRQMLALLDDILAGRASGETLSLLEERAKTVNEGALCALGKTFPNPVLFTLKNFRSEYEEHIFHKKCRTGRCAALTHYHINPEKCKSCSLCARKCPVDAIFGERRKPYRIDTSKCIRCGACAEICKFGAVEK